MINTQLMQQLHQAAQNPEALAAALAKFGPPPHVPEAGAGPAIPDMGLPLPAAGAGPQGVGDALPAAQTQAQPASEEDPLAVMPGQSKAPEGVHPIEYAKGQWKNFMSRMQTDPNFKQSVLRTGLSLMHSPKMGETGWDRASTALETGVNSLELLRERDRKAKIDTQEQTRRDNATNSEISTRAAGVENDKARTGIYENQVLSNDIAVKNAHDLAVKELDERIKHNRNSEGIDRTNAAANAAGTGNNSADAFKINGLAADYVRQGMGEVEARAKATREIQTTGKNMGAGKIFNDAMNQEIELWQSSFDNLGKVPDKNTLLEMQNRAKERVATIMKLNVPDGGPQIPPGSGSTGTIVRPGQTAPAEKKPKTITQINQLKAAGTTPEQIAAGIRAQGEDPALYGYK